MYGFFQKIKMPFEIVIYSFFSFENRPWGSKSSADWGQNRVLPWVKIECIHTKSVFVWMHSIYPWCTLFWPQAALYFDPQQHLNFTPRAYFPYAGFFFKESMVKLLSTWPTPSSFFTPVSLGSWLRERMHRFYWKYIYSALVVAW